MSQINFQISFPKFFSHQILSKKYATTKTLNQINTNHIIFNEKCRIVSKFKDFLILDDATEFLKAFYKKPETILKLKQIFLFYETYRKIFPNYIAIFPENKHLYRNIRKKQKMIDAVNEIKKEEEENRKNLSQKNIVFTDTIKKLLDQNFKNFDDSKSSISISFRAKGIFDENDKSINSLKNTINVFNDNLITPKKTPKNSNIHLQQQTALNNNKNFFHNKLNNKSIEHIKNLNFNNNIFINNSNININNNLNTVRINIQNNDLFNFLNKKINKKYFYKNNFSNNYLNKSPSPFNFSQKQKKIKNNHKNSINYTLTTTSTKKSLNKSWKENCRNKSSN